MYTDGSQSHNWYERLLNLISVVKPGEGKGCVLLSFNVCLLMTAFYLLKVIREPLILAYGGAEFKSYATAYQAGLLMLIVPLFSILYHRYSDSEIRSTIINRVLLFFISNLLIFALLQHLQINIGMAFYVWLGIFSVMVIAQFWAFAADSYNVRCGQRLFVILTVGATFGALLGSQLAGIIFPVIGIKGIMILAAAIFLISAYLTSKTTGTIPVGVANNEPLHQEDSHNQWFDGFSVIFQSKYLQLIALFVTLIVFISSTGEYVLSRLVVEHSEALLATSSITDLDVWRTQFYANYNFWLNLGSFLLQLFVVSGIFKKVGIKGAVLVLPIIMIIGSGLMLLLPIIAFVKIAMIIENSANYSITNTTKHALFLPVSRKLKYLGKTTIDTFFFRFGDVLYGAFVFVGTQIFDFSITTFLISNLILASILFVIAWRVGHYNQLEVQKNRGNSPPEVMATIPHLMMPSGTLSKFSISECTFVDPDIGDALKFHAKQESGEALPKWVKFDRMTRTFSFNPPEDYIGVLHIEIVAADFDGLTASSRMEVTFFQEAANN